MENKFKKFKKVPLIVSTILLITSCSLFIYLYQNTQKNDQVSSDLEKQLKDEASKREEVKSLDRMLKSMEGERATLDSHFIVGASSDAVPFLNMLETLAPKVGAEAAVALVDAPKDNSGLVVGVNVQGSFESLYKFITLLENAPYELDVLYVDLERGQETTSADGVEAPVKWSAVIKVKLLSFVP
ncbi:MAG: hypothetical protein V4486_00475 [Patescibacteria group bacterium]